MLTKIADFYDDEVETAVNAMTSMLEPLLMVFLAVSSADDRGDVSADIPDRLHRRLTGAAGAVSGAFRQGGAVCPAYPCRKHRSASK
jgi:hypothetical protein